MGRLAAKGLGRRAARPAHLTRGCRWREAPWAKRVLSIGAAPAARDSAPRRPFLRANSTEFLREQFRRNLAVPLRFTRI